MNELDDIIEQLQEYKSNVFETLEEDHNDLEDGLPHYNQLTMMLNHMN